MDDLLSLIDEMLTPIEGGDEDYDSLIDRVSESRIVLLGEATYGSHEFYAERRRITQRLILEKGFDAVAMEGDWPGGIRVNRFLQDPGSEFTVEDALDDFRSFPSWMWRNTEVLELVDWLARFNQTQRPGGDFVGFFGLDPYSLFGSFEALTDYLDRVDPKAAQRARQHFARFDHLGNAPEHHGQGAGIGIEESCKKDLIEHLMELSRQSGASFRTQSFRTQGGCPNEEFYAQLNARLVRNAEQYYRTLLEDGVAAWNGREVQMVETLKALDQHMTVQKGEPAKIVVWAHNSHVGDVRATAASGVGKLTMGQLLREAYGDGVYILGLTTYKGTVTAASDWGGPAKQVMIGPALPESFEFLFHDASLPEFFLDLHYPALAALDEPRCERAIGVIYHPGAEPVSHYLKASIRRQFDGIVHLDETSAVIPLDRSFPRSEVDVAKICPRGV